MNRGWGISPEFRKAEMNERLLWKWVKVAWLLWESCQISNLLLEVISERWDFAKQSFMKAKTRQQNNFEIPSLSLYYTMFENHRKSLSHNCERSELRLHFEWTKVHEKCQNGPFWRVFGSLKLTVKQCYQTCQF